MQGAWGVHPSPRPEITCGVVMQLVLCIKICLRHQPVTPFLSGVSPPKKNSGSTPFFILSCNHLVHFLPFSISLVSENNQQTNVTLVKKFNDWRYDWRDSLEKRMPWLGARQSLLTTSTHSDYSDWGSIISEKKSNNPAPWIYGSMPNPGVIWYWINEDDCDASRNPGT